MGMHGAESREFRQLRQQTWTCQECGSEDNFGDKILCRRCGWLAPQYVCDRVRQFQKTHPEQRGKGQSKGAGKGQGKGQGKSQGKGQGKGKSWQRPSAPTRPNRWAEGVPNSVRTVGLADDKSKLLESEAKNRVLSQRIKDLQEGHTGYVEENPDENQAAGEERQKDVDAEYQEANPVLVEAWKKAESLCKAVVPYGDFVIIQHAAAAKDKAQEAMRQSMGPSLRRKRLIQSKERLETSIEAMHAEEAELALKLKAAQTKRTHLVAKLGEAEEALKALPPEKVAAEPSQEAQGLAGPVQAGVSSALAELLLRLAPQCNAKALAEQCMAILLPAIPAPCHPEATEAAESADAAREADEAMEVSEEQVDQFIDSCPEADFDQLWNTASADEASRMHTLVEQSVAARDIEMDPSGEATRKGNRRLLVKQAAAGSMRGVITSVVKGKARKKAQPNT